MTGEKDPYGYNAIKEWGVYPQKHGFYAKTDGGLKLDFSMTNHGVDLGSFNLQEKDLSGGVSRVWIMIDNKAQVIKYRLRLNSWEIEFKEQEKTMEINHYNSGNLNFSQQRQIILESIAGGRVGIKSVNQPAGEVIEWRKREDKTRAVHKLVCRQDQKQIFEAFQLGRAMYLRDVGDVKILKASLQFLLPQELEPLIEVLMEAGRDCRAESIDKEMIAEVGSGIKIVDSGLSPVTELELNEAVGNLFNHQFD